MYVSEEAGTAMYGAQMERIRRGSYVPASVVCFGRRSRFCSIQCTLSSLIEPANGAAAAAALTFLLLTV